MSYQIEPGYALKRARGEWIDEMIGESEIVKARFLGFYSVHGHRMGVFQVGRSHWAQLPQNLRRTGTGDRRRTTARHARRTSKPQTYLGYGYEIHYNPSTKKYGYSIYGVGTTSTVFHDRAEAVRVVRARIEQRAGHGSRLVNPHNPRATTRQSRAENTERLRAFLIHRGATPSQAEKQIRQLTKYQWASADIPKATWPQYENTVVSTLTINTPLTPAQASKVVDHNEDLVRAAWRRRMNPGKTAYQLWEFYRLVKAGKTALPKTYYGNRRKRR